MNYIATLENVMHPDLCQQIIDRFEHDVEYQEYVELEGHRSFTELNINKHEDWKDIQDYLVGLTKNGLYTYKKGFDLDDRVWPEQYGFEQFRIKRYLPNDKDGIEFHVDVENHASARRFLVFFLYLNTVEQGGHTAFKLNRSIAEYDMMIQPEVGKMLVFPPLWTHPHVATHPISGPKYIIGSYLHYL